ncbi:MAG: hypothetical protein V4469_00980 [Patescibacteria group bacterium]
MYLVKNKGSQNPILRYLVAGPLIWLMIVPIIAADILVEIYHRICFPIYGIRLVKRSQYIRIVDRAKLPYLTWSEKIGCAYCGYMNGWLHYASVIAGRTENYFCAISHLEARGYVPSEHEKSFIKYGDGSALKKRYANHELKYGKEIE